MTATQPEPAAGQTWQRKDERDGVSQVLIISADQHFVHILGRRRSEVRRARFATDYVFVRAN